MNKVILTLIFSLFGCSLAYAYEKITGGPWNTTFGDDTEVIQKKIKDVLPDAEVRVIPGKQVSITTPFEFAGQNFIGAEFLFNDNKFSMCMIHTGIEYNDYKNVKLNEEQAQEWLDDMWSFVYNYIQPIEENISTIYGPSSKNGSPVDLGFYDATWREGEGNMCQLIVIRRSNSIDNDNLEETGYIPTYSMVLYYVKDSDIPKNKKK